jgi:hypothetical protein
MFDSYSSDMAVGISAIIAILLLSFGLLSYPAVGQTLQGTQGGPSSPSIKDPSSSSSLSSEAKTHSVKILSPTKGQQVPIGRTLVVSGTSNGGTNSSSNTSNCQVSVIVNGIKPYQQAIPTGKRGPNDYSNWTFNATPKYSPIKEGQNKITAKYSCGNTPTLVSHNSVNVTGVSGTGANLKTPTTNSSHTNPTSSHAVVPVPLVSESSLFSSGIRNGTGIKSMSVSGHFAKGSVHPGDTQSISFTVTDANTSTPVTGANITGNVTAPSGATKQDFGGITDSNGTASYSWKIGVKDPTGHYSVEVKVSAPGYKISSASKSFKVTSTTTSSSTSHKVNSGVNSNSNDNSQSHPSTIITIPHIRFPEIRIPFHLPFH